MTTFNEREKGFEKKYQHDREMTFKAQARRNKLLGLWAAELMEMDGDAAAAYAKEVIESDFEEPGDDDVLRKVLGDLSGKGVECDKQKLRKKMDELLAVAIEQLNSDA